MNERVNLAQLLLERLEFLLMWTVFRGEGYKLPSDTDEALVYWYKLNVQHRQRLL